MEPPPSSLKARGFGVLDVMILVAALATSLGAVRGWVLLRSRIPQFDNGPLPVQLKGFQDWFMVIRMVMLALSLAIVPLNLRRGGWRKLRRWGTPGTIVPIAVILSLLAGVMDQRAFPLVMNFYYLYASGEQRVFRLSFVMTDITLCSSAVAVAWAALAISGSWSRETDWVGHLGRAVGVTWIVQAVGYRLYEVYMYLGYHQVVI